MSVRDQKIEQSDEESYEPQWPDCIKIAFLRALKKYGHKNVRLLSKELPGVPTKDIRAMINKYQTISRFVIKEKQSPLSQWLLCGLFKPEESVLPQALLYICLFEKHPTPLECKNCDFRAIYNFLYCLSSGQTLPNLSPATERVLYGLLSDIMNQVWPASQKEIFDYLGNIYNRRKIQRVYSGKRKQSDVLPFQIGDGNAE
ncbi:hypothetical protein KM043_010589 [Ampulex compressa]|nr:hypothetical protein KM043_010589 [Ampulex compressa]